MAGEALEFFRSDKKRTFGWHLQEANGAIICGDAGQGYENPLDCVEMAFRILGGEYAGLVRQGDAGGRADAAEVAANLRRVGHYHLKAI